MAKAAANTLLVTFQQVAGGPQMDSSALVSELDALRSVSETQVDAVSSNTEAVTQNTASRGATGVARDVASTLGKTALSMMPLVGLFANLFGGGGQPEQPPPLVKYAPPAPIQFEGSIVAPGATPNGVTADATPQAAAPSAAPQTVTPQVTIQVQAMDSRSFLDHSQEIAQAVREAMLNMHPLNDVVSDL
ncbi:MAG TPA: hypothetical protein VFA33_30265 [Bryobacteraceae bacterium]|nr:hypothetical protein [Bryobacteraceae bacterium]